MNISYHEKSIWIILATTLLIFGGYFFLAFKFIASPIIPDFPLIPLFVVTIVVYVIIQSVLQAGLALFHLQEADAKEDERDTLIELKATRISYFVLVFGVWVAGFSMFQYSSPLVMANIMMFFFVLAEVVGYGLELYYYRRGV